MKPPPFLMKNETLVVLLLSRLSLAVLWLPLLSTCSCRLDFEAFRFYPVLQLSVLHSFSRSKIDKGPAKCFPSETLNVLHPPPFGDTCLRPACLFYLSFQPSDVRGAIIDRVFVRILGSVL